MPIGRAIRAPIATDSAESWMCSSRRVGIPSGPLQCEGSTNHLMRLSMASMSDAPRPREREALHAEQEKVDHDVAQDDQDRVTDEPDLGGGGAQSRVRDEQRKQRDRRDRVKDSENHIGRISHGAPPMSRDTERD